jgi:uncharacterized protein YacL
VIRYIRVLGAALGGLIGLVLAGADGGLFRDATYAGFLLAAWVIAWVIVGFAILPYLTIVPATWLISRVESLSTAEFITAVVGLLLGLLMGLLLGLPLSQLPQPFGSLLPLGVSLLLGLGMLGLTVAKRKDLVGAAETVGIIRHPDVATTAIPGSGEPRIVVDTSAIIDGRIAEIVEDSVPSETEVDAKLVALARTRSRVILTNDFNLNRVAELQGVRVMNINSLANAVKPAVLPGEELRVRVIQEGKEAGQGVGFLDDGTMIVVEGGARHIDKDLDVAVTRVLQTVAGRMIFAQPRLD